MTDFLTKDKYQIYIKTRNVGQCPTCWLPCRT